MAPREPTPDVIAAYVRAGTWQERTVHELVDAHATEHPDREAAVDQTRRLTYGELLAESGRLARFLVDADVPTGAAVAVQSGNRVELAIAHLACSRAGVTFVPLSDAWRREELRHLLGVAQAAVAIVPAAGRHDFLADLRALRPELPALRLVASADGDGDFDVRAILARPADPVARDPDPNAPRYVMVSSGSTSLPKLSLWSDNNLWSFAETWSRAVALTCADRMVGLAPAGTGAVGYVYGVLFPLLKGATSILLERWDPATAIALLERERATLATAVPTQIVKLLQEPAAATARLAQLRAVTNAGAPMPPEVAERLERAWDCHIQTVYGATDGGVPLMTTVDDPPAKRHRTVGRVVALTDVLLVDDAMREVPAGEPGEILWRGPTKSFGYLNDDARTAEAFTADGYYRSGDLAQVDADGYHTIVGRAKDMIIRGGQNISPGEVEEAVALHPAVSEVAVVGVPDPVFGERVCAAVALRDGAALDLEALVAFLAQRRMAKFKLPERLEVVPELPRTASGKTSKAEVRALVALRSRPRRRSATSSAR
jgi:acyl-CoA synthetase (AMP-forming)/AMP-acid ligase II